MSCTTYIVYKFNLSQHHANFGQFKAKQVRLLQFKNKIILSKYGHITLKFVGRYLIWVVTIFLF